MGSVSITFTAGDVTQTVTAETVREALALWSGVHGRQPDDTHWTIRDGWEVTFDMPDSDYFHTVWINGPVPEAEARAQASRLVPTGRFVEATRVTGAVVTHNR